MRETMAQKLVTPQIPESFKGLLSNGKVVQNAILERTEKKVSLLEGRQSVVLYSKSGTPPTLNHELDISSPNFIALGESLFILKLRYSVKDNLTRLTTRTGYVRRRLHFPGSRTFESNWTDGSHPVEQSVGHANRPAHLESHGKQHR